MAISKGTQYITDPNTIPVTTSTGENNLKDSLNYRIIYFATKNELDLLSSTDLIDGQQASVQEDGDYYWNSGTSSWVKENKINERVIYEDLDGPLEDILVVSRPSSKTVTVGSSGDYQSLNDAISALSRYSMEHSAESEIQFEISILSGTVISEQVFINSLNLSNIKITSEDAAVSVDRSAMTQNDPDTTFSSNPFMLGYNGAKLPIIACVFDMDASTGTASHLIRVRYGSYVFFEPNTGGLSGNADRLLEVSHGSVGVARNASITGGIGIGARVSNGSILHAGTATISGNADANVAVSAGFAVLNNADLTNAGTNGIQANTGASKVSAAGADTSGASNIGVLSTNGAVVYFEDGVSSNCGVYGASMEHGGKISAPSATITNNPQNVFIENGSEFTALLATLSGATNVGVSLSNGCNANLQGADVTGCGDFAVVANRGSNANCVGADGTEADGGQANKGFQINLGSTMSVHNTSGVTNRTLNSLTTNGIMFG